MKTLSVLTLTVAIFTACQSTAIQNISIPKETKQLLVVSTANWSTKNGTLQRFEKKNDVWNPTGASVSIVLGRNGLAWGLGLHQIPTDAKYVKKEGDGKAPAGLFNLGNAFGYKPYDIDFPYSVYKRTDHCVDDGHSQWYNQIIDSTTVDKDYKSFEHMKLRNYLYQYGIVVKHNPENIPNSGSCIFIHIKSKTGNGTAGCTAMKENKITTILKWLRENKKPLLLQLPKEEMNKVDLN